MRRRRSPLEKMRAAVFGRQMRTALVWWWKDARLATAMGGRRSRRGRLRGPFAALAANRHARRLAGRVVRRLRSVRLAVGLTTWMVAAAEAAAVRRQLSAGAERWRRAARLDVLGAFRELRLLAAAADDNAEAVRRHRRGPRV